MELFNSPATLTGDFLESQSTARRGCQLLMRNVKPLSVDFNLNMQAASYSHCIPQLVNAMAKIGM